jgi:hypothetical protein
VHLLIIKIAGEENGEIIQTSDDVKNGLKNGSKKTVQLLLVM